MERELLTAATSQCCKPANACCGLRRFLRWMDDARGKHRFSELTKSDLIAYRNHIQSVRAMVRVKGQGYVDSGKALSPHGRFMAALAVQYVARSQTRVPDALALSCREVDDIFASAPPSPEKATPRIPDDIFVTLVNGAIDWLGNTAPTLFVIDDVLRRFRASRKPSDPNCTALIRSITDLPKVRFGKRELSSGDYTARDHSLWITHTRAAAAIVIAALTGMRISEVLSLKTGCLKTTRLRDGRVIVRLAGTLYKTSEQVQGDPAEWVAGWDEPQNPIRLAVSVLEQIHKRTGLAEPYVFKAFRRRTSLSANFSRNAIASHMNRFAHAIGIIEWTFAPHQFRKTFARFVSLAAPNGALALQRHYKHISIQMTERYFPTDPDLMDEIMEASAELVEDKLDEILRADRLAGIKGEQILAQNAPYRGSAGAEARKEMVRLTMSDAGARVVLHAYGVCIYEAEFAKCGGKLENVGIEVCAECPNLSVDRSHQPFWKEEIVALDLVADELKGVDVVNAGVERQRARAARFITLLG
jgi:integrase